MNDEQQIRAQVLYPNIGVFTVNEFMATTSVSPAPASPASEAAACSW